MQTDLGHVLCRAAHGPAVVGGGGGGGGACLSSSLRFVSSDGHVEMK